MTPFLLIDYVGLYTKGYDESVENENEETLNICPRCVNEYSNKLDICPNCRITGRTDGQRPTRPLSSILFNGIYCMPLMTVTKLKFEYMQARKKELLSKTK